MDQQKMIEEIKAVVRSACNREGIAKRCPERIAEALINANYGYIEEALKEFANKLYSQSGVFCNAQRREKDISVNEVLPYEMELINHECVKVNDIEKTLKEFLGNIESDTLHNDYSKRNEIVIGIMNDIPLHKYTYTLSDERISELEKSSIKYKEKAREIVDNDDTLTLYESADGSYWTCRKCGLTFECKENSAHYCPNCGRKIYDFIKENKGK